MILFFLGTPAELIKCHSVIRCLEQSGHSVLIIDSGQQSEALKAELTSLSYGSNVRVETYLPGHLHLKYANIETGWQALRWMARCLWQSVRSRKRFQKVNFWVVHGDTLSTLLGSILGRVHRAKTLAHIEAGLRTGNVLNPFPEEITRRLVSRIARLHFSPSREATQNLKLGSIKGEIIETPGNTQLAALAEITLAAKKKVSLPAGKFGIGNLHRVENLKFRWNDIKKAIRTASEKHSLVLIRHSAFRNRLERDEDFYLWIKDNPNIVLSSRMPFREFIVMLSKAHFLLTDSSGNQDDASCLGTPTLILRTHCESRTALWPDGSAVLSRFNEEAMNSFFSDPEKFRTPPSIPNGIAADMIARRLMDSGI